MKDKSLDYGNCETARFCGEEAYVKIASLRTESSYKAGVVDELAQDNEVQRTTAQVT